MAYSKFKILCLLCCVFAVFDSFAQKSITIKQADQEIIFDGVDNENFWKNCEFQELTQIEGDTSAKNNTARFKLSYYKDWLYVFVDVIDDVLDTSQSKNSWEKDCVRLSIRLDTNYILSLAEPEVRTIEKVFGHKMDDWSAPYENISVVEKETAYGRTQEWKIPFDSLHMTYGKTWNRKNFRFEIANRDNDGSGNLYNLIWSSPEDEPFWIPSMGYVTLENFSSVQNFDNNHETKNIIVKTGMIEFPVVSDYTLYNIKGMVIKKGHKSTGFSTTDLYKGVYLIKTEYNTFKFIKL